MDEGRIKAAFNVFLERLKRDKRLEFTVYCTLVLLCAVLLLSGKGKEGKTDEYTAPQEKYNDSGELEQRLMDTLSLVRGAGRVEVMITYDTGAEIVPAMSSDMSESLAGMDGAVRTESLQPVTVYQDGENGALILMERMPQVRGVIVVAEGAADISVRMKLQSAVSAVLGVDASRVEVLEMGISGLEE